MRFALLMMLCAISGCSSANQCEGDTPGMIMCGGIACRIDRCWAPRDGGMGFPPIYGTPSCLPDSGTPKDTDGQPVTCDGPEDCPEGQACQLNEFSIACGTEGFSPDWGPACHSDCDCPSGKRCNGSECHQPQ